MSLVGPIVAVSALPPVAVFWALRTQALINRERERERERRKIGGHAQGSSGDHSRGNDRI